MTSTARGLSILILPIWGMAADYFGATRRVLMLALGVSLIILLTFPLAETYQIIFIILVLFILFEGPIVSLSDALVLNHLGNQGELYGTFRFWGSLGYMLAVTPIGLVIEQTGARNLFYIAAGIMLLALINTWKLPEGKEIFRVSRLSDFKMILKNKKLFFFLLFTFSLQAPLMVHFTFFPIFFTAQGGGETLFGLALLLGAASELIIFQKSTFFLRKIKLPVVLLISALCFSLRWSLIGLFPVITVLLLSQLLNSLTFALFHVTAVNYISRLMGADFQATGQNLYASTIAISSVVGSLLGGLAYDAWGGSRMYLVGGLFSLAAGLVYFYQQKFSQA